MATVITAPASNAALVIELQSRLKVPRSTDVPKTEHVNTLSALLTFGPAISLDWLHGTWLK